MSSIQFGWEIWIIEIQIRTLSRAIACLCVWQVKKLVSVYLMRYAAEQQRLFMSCLCLVYVLIMCLTGKKAGVCVPDKVSWGTTEVVYVLFIACLYVDYVLIMCLTGEEAGVLVPDEVSWGTTEVVYVLFIACLCVDYVLIMCLTGEEAGVRVPDKVRWGTTRPRPALNQHVPAGS